ncbi:hypothetical protein [Hyalangium versicolor]|uniref:hypothetical protein n=1 Tax=Hyalangium versicolor TaxID=2861190 RepID=UPI001CCF07C2|nr:hypothetical protein [Hyalangium versicolor]
MSVRSTNSSGSGLVNRSTTQDKPAATSEKNTVAQPKSSGLPDQLQSSFERSGEINRNWNKTYSSDRPMYTPKLPTTGVGGALAGLLGKLPKLTKEGSFEKGVSAYKKEGSFGDPNGVASGTYKLSALEASVNGKGSVTLENGALSAHGEVHAQATLLDAAANFRAKLGPVSADGEAHAYAGVKANASGDAIIDPINGKYVLDAGADAFAGARIGASANVNLGDYGGVHGTAEAWAGIGVTAKAHVGLENGRFSARFELGAALGLGFKLGFGVDINFKKIGEGIKNIFKKPVEIVKNVGEKVGNFFKSAASGVTNAVKDAGHAIAEGVKSVGKAVGDTVKKIFSGW